MPIDLKFIDLFSGIGGFHIALSNLGAKCVFASEIDKQTRDTYKENFGLTPDGDITKINESEIPNHNILAAGFPCQSFSINGFQKGFNDSRGILFFDVVRIAKYHKPEIIILENVDNFYNHDSGRTLFTVKSEIEKLGYSFHSSILNASNYGIPQARIRTYMICLKNRNDFQFPKASMKKCCLKDILLPIEDTKCLEIDKKFKPKGWFFDRNPLFEIEDNPPGCILEPVRLGYINKGRQGERIYADWGHAITLSSNGGGVGAKTGLYLVGGKNGSIRKLHPRECARIMGFPESFKLNNSFSACWRQFGNSVVVPLIQLISEKAIQSSFS